MSRGVVSPQQPLVVVATLFIAGIVLGDWGDLGIVATLVLTLLTLGVYLWRGERWIGWIAIVGVGGFVAAANRSDSLPYDHNTTAMVEVTAHNKMMINALRSTETGEWNNLSEEIYFWSDSTIAPNVGDRYLLDLRLREWRGVSTTYISNKDILERLTSHASYTSYARRVNDWAYGRLEQLGVSEDVLSLSGAMLLGRRELLDRSRRESYIRSGAAHLLAVSGLHLGVLIVVIGALFRWLYLVPNGVAWHRVVVVLLIVTYAFVVGLSASVVRAMMMATIFGLSVIATRRYQLLNTLSCAAILMLCIDPSMVYDVAFRLSFVSVLAIGVWVVPLSRALYRWSLDRGWTRLFRTLFNAVASALLLGVVCSIATLPLVAHTFGIVSFMGALLSPLVTLTTFVILLTSLLWVVAGFGFAAPLFGWVLSGAVWLQDGAVGYMSSGWGDAMEFGMNGWWATALYLIYILLTICAGILLRNKKRNEVSSA